MPKGNAVIYKPKEVSWEREVTLKKKKKHSSRLELRAGFSHCVRPSASRPNSGTSLRAVLAKLPPCPSRARCHQPFPHHLSRSLLQCEKLHHQSPQIHPFADIQKISWDQLLSKFYLNSPSFPPSWVSLSLEVRLISAFGEHVKIVQLNGE